MSRLFSSRVTAVSLNAVLFAVLASITAPAAAQEGEQRPPEEEEAGGSRGGYAWGEAPPDEDAGGPRLVYRRFGTVFANIGAGGTIRMLAYADRCDPETNESCRFSPGYLQLAGGYMFETDGILQHGVGLGVSANLTGEGTGFEGLDPFAQWALTPRYYARLWLDDWFQLRGHFGVPLSFGAITGTRVPEGSQLAFNWALELQVDVVFKFLTGLGIYAGVNVATWFASDAFPVWPTFSFEGGVVFDYEVLP